MMLISRMYFGMIGFRKTLFWSPAGRNLLRPLSIKSMGNSGRPGLTNGHLLVTGLVNCCIMSQSLALSFSIKFLKLANSCLLV